MRGMYSGSVLLAVTGLAIERGLIAAWPFDPRFGLALLLPLAAVLVAHVRSARQRRLRRYGLGW